MMVASHRPSWPGGVFWKTSPLPPLPGSGEEAWWLRSPSRLAAGAAPCISGERDPSMLKLARREGTSSTNLGSSNIQTDSLWRRGGHLWAAEKLDPKSSWTFPGVRFQEERRRGEGERCQEQDFQDGVAVAGSGLASHGPGLRGDYRQGADGGYSHFAQTRMHRRRTPSRQNKFRHCSNISTWLWNCVENPLFTLTLEPVQSSITLCRQFR